MKKTLPEILLIDLPTFPKGTLSLSLFAVGAALKNNFSIRYLDINLQHPDEVLKDLEKLLGETAIVGIKVSSQNFQIAKELSARIKECAPKIKVLWGGEFPTLLPDECLPFCDTLVSGQIEPIAGLLSKDYFNGGLKKTYQGNTPENLEFDWKPDFSIQKRLDAYYSFMGLPLETSRGCTQKCVFCLVHVMQKNYVLKSAEQLDKELPAYRGKFVNIIDYNIGVEPEHVIKVSNALKKRGVAGWMGEMCIESLDNDAMLAAMRDSGCRMIYCGLESIDETALRSVNKANTNHIENYERIIRKAQSYGIQIGAGIILGLKGTDENTFKNTYHFFQRMGIIYAKLTFLTYNPGTKVFSSMKRTGDYSTYEFEYYDGNHLTFIPKGLSKDVVYKDTAWFIRKFYHPWNIVLRSFNSKMSFLTRLEFILFSYCYGETYRQWLQKNVFDDEKGFTELLLAPFQKTRAIRIAEALLNWLKKK